MDTKWRYALTMMIHVFAVYPSDQSGLLMLWLSEFYSRIIYYRISYVNSWWNWDFYSRFRNEHGYRRLNTDVSKHGKKKINPSKLCPRCCIYDDFHNFAVYPSDQIGLLIMWLSEKPSLGVMYINWLGVKHAAEIKVLLVLCYIKARPLIWGVVVKNTYSKDMKILVQ